MNKLVDNIADVDDSVTPPAIEVKPKSPEDEYMEKFDDLSRQNDIANNLVAKINDQPDDQQRLYTAIKCIKLLQNQNESFLELLILMNNFFSAK